MTRLFFGPNMSLRLLFPSIGAAILLASTILTGLYLGTETQDRFQQIGASWSTYTGEAERRGDLLSRIRSHLGYGGMIHNFKNYVLRQQPVYLASVEAQLKDFRATIAEYRKSGASQSELEALDVIETTIANYEAKLPTAKKAAAESWPATRTDALVKVDDVGALDALAALERYWRNKHKETTEAIANSVIEGRDQITTGFRFLAGLVVVALAIYALFFLLQRELRQTVGLLSNELTERKAAEHVAKKFSRAVDQSSATIVITDTDGHIEYVNRKFCDVSGYASDEVLGRTPRFLQSGDTPDDAYMDLSRQIALGKEWRGVFRNLKKDGSSYWAKTDILPLRDEDGRITHYIGVGEDITERRKAREQIHKAQKMEAVGLLASGVAHDFNNVLTTIIGNVHLALMDAPADGELREELEQIEIAAKRARNLVGQVLAFARRQPSEPMTLRAGDAVREVCRLMRASIQPNIRLECSIEDDELSVKADPTRLHQVIMNLCSNAAEAIEPADGCITLSVTSRDGSEETDPLVCLSVEDDGSGMPKTVLDSVFDPFFTTKPPGKGTGLGLSVVANLVAEMGGQIVADSTEGVGTRFEILLPQSETAPSQAAGRDSLDRGSGRILLVDDEPDVVSTCRKILESLGYDVEAHIDPTAAVARFEADPEAYDLVMTDFVMPDLNGEQVTRAVRTQRADCPVIVCTGYQPGTLDPEEFMPFRLIEKPVEPAVLARTVRLLMENNGLQSPPR